jgi:hypothetical protein
MPTGVSLFVWLPEERAKWVEMRAKHEYWCAILGLNQFGLMQSGGIFGERAGAGPCEAHTNGVRGYPPPPWCGSGALI